MDSYTQCEKFWSFLEELVARYGDDLIDDCCIQCQMIKIREHSAISSKDLFHARVLFGSIFVSPDENGIILKDNDWLARI